jgi:hypothetical protein
MYDYRKGRIYVMLAELLTPKQHGDAFMAICYNLAMQTDFTT